MEWAEFHRHKATIERKQEKIRAYARVLLCQDLRDRPRKPRCSVIARVSATGDAIMRRASAAHLSLAGLDFSGYLTATTTRR